MTAAPPPAAGASTNLRCAGNCRCRSTGFFLALSLVVLAACAGPSTGGTYSAASPVRFGSAVYANPSYANPPGLRPDESPQPVTPPSAEATAPAEETKVIGIVQPAEDSTKPLTQSESAAALPQEAVAARHPKPEELVGLRPDEVKRILGSPALVRRDRPAQIWQYRSPDCVLDLFLYPSPAAGEAARAAKSTAGDTAEAVVYYELRARTAKEKADDSCFNALVAAAHARRPG